MFANILSRYWWLTALRGVVWILFGIYVFAEPAISLFLLAALFGAFVLVDGVINVVNAIGGRRENENWWVFLLVGLAGICVGLLTLAHPTITAVALLFYLAIWSIATGLLEIIGAIRLRREIDGEFWFILAGLVSVAFGVLLMARPSYGVLALLWLVASYAIIFGVILIALAIRSRKFITQIDQDRTATRIA